MDVGTLLSSLSRGVRIDRSVTTEGDLQSRRAGGRCPAPGEARREGARRSAMRALPSG